MDLMLSLSRHCSLEGGLAQRSAAGCVAGGVCGEDAGGGRRLETAEEGVG